MAATSLTPIALLLALAGGAQSPPPAAEATSLLGVPLVPTPAAGARRDRLEAGLVAAEAQLARTPDDPDALIWVGRRQAYLGRYRDAIATFSKGTDRFPDDPRFLRHRGHRYITIRAFERAEADLARAAGLIRGRTDAVEPDGQPNARNVPTSTLHFNIWYHLGLARYLRGDFTGAREAYVACLALPLTPDARVATTHWLYMTLRRLGRGEDAERLVQSVPGTLDIIENVSYERLVRLYQGRLQPGALVAEAAAGLDRTTVTYGVAIWHLTGGRRDEALALLKSIVHGPQWAAFGSIAAEADLAAMQSK